MFTFLSLETFSFTFCGCLFGFFFLLCFSAEKQLAFQWQYFIQLNIPKYFTLTYAHSKEPVGQMWLLGSPEKERKASLSQSDRHALTRTTLLPNEHHCRFDMWCTGDNCKEMETRMEKNPHFLFSKLRKGIKHWNSVSYPNFRKKM